jgi:hypothetical protein
VQTALKCRDLEKDPTPAESLMVDCCACDPDNPRSVPTRKCGACRGTGKVPAFLAAIVGEIHESRLRLLRGDKDKYEED